QTITLTGGEMSIADPVVITGPGSGLLTISGASVVSATNRIFNSNVVGGYLVISGMTLTSGKVSGGDGGAVKVTTGAIIATDMTFNGNTTTNGGGAVGIAAVANHSF